MKYVQYAGHVFGPEEIEAATEALSKGWLVGGRFTREFEKALSEYFGGREVVLVNSGSSANLLALAALGLPEGSEVITTALAFPTTVAAILHNRLIPVFVDVEMGTYVAPSKNIRCAISPSTSAMIMAHTLGNPFPPVYAGHLIEDCCDALGSTWHERRVGTLGDLATLSFYPAHHITSLDSDELILVVNSDGGMSWRPIGSFCDNEDVRMWRCVSFNKQGKLEIAPITGFVKHPCRETLIRIRLEGGRTTIVSASHSVFTPSANGPEPRATKELKIGDLIYAPRTIPTIGSCKSINVTKYMRGSWKPYTSEIPITSQRARFLGWYVAEGCVSGPTKQGNYNTTFTLGPSEENIALQIRDDVSTIFGKRVRIYPKYNSRGWTVIISDKGIFKFLRGMCGTGATQKRVPSFIFAAPSPIRKAFLDAYFSGDGHHRNQNGEHDQCEAKTVSRELAHGVHALLLQEEKSPRFRIDPGGERRFPKGYVSKCLPAVSISFGTSGNGRANAKSFRGKHGSVPRRFGDLVLLRITAMDEVLPTTPFVYDLAVEGYENFVAGVGMVVHNTGEGGAVITPSRKLYDKVRSLRDWGKACTCPDRPCKDRFSGGYDHKYTYTNIGYNMGITEVQAAMGWAQFKKLPGFIEKRKANFKSLVNILTPYEDRLILPRATPGSDPAWFAFPLTIRKNAGFSRLDIVRFLETSGIETRPIFAGNILRQPGYRGIPHRVAGYLTNTDYIHDNSFFIGLYPGIGPEELGRIDDAFHKFMLHSRGNRT